MGERGALRHTEPVERGWRTTPWTPPAPPSMLRSPLNELCSHNNTYVTLVKLWLQWLTQLVVLS